MSYLIFTSNTDFKKYQKYQQLNTKRLFGAAFFFPVNPNISIRLLTF